MKILYHHRTASKDGQEVHIRELILALRAMGHEVVVVGPGGDPTAARIDDSMGGQRAGLGRVRALVPDLLMPIANRAYGTWFARHLRRVVASFRPDVIYERHALDNDVGVRIARESGLPLLLEVNAPLSREEFEQGKLASLEPALSREVDVMRAATAVMAVTRVLAEILMSDGVSPARVHVIQNGASLEFLEAPRDRSLRDRWCERDSLVLGFVGFPRPWHGLDRVIHALAEHRDGVLAKARFWLAGEGPSVAGLTSLAMRLGVADRVRIVGVLNRREVIPFLDSIDVALQPAATRYASPLKLFEYLARGVPVIAPRQPNICEIVADERSALLFEPDDATDFARRLVQLAGDTELRARIGRGGRARIDESGYTWERNAERVVAIAAAAKERR